MPEGTAVKRETEGRGARKAARGRPAGSVNRPKSLIPKNVGNKLLANMEAQLAPEQFEYLKGVVRDGKPIETKNEVDTLIALLTRNLYPALIHEMLPVEDGGLGGVYRKDVTDRLKIVHSLFNLRHQIDKNDEPEDTKSDTILTITAKRGFNLDRLGILVGQQPDSMERDSHRIGGESDPIRALPDTLSERPFEVSYSEQGSPDRVLDGDSDGGRVLRDDEDELQG